MPRYEENAEYLPNIKGWVCKTCHRYFGDQQGSEHMARYCHADDTPCDCGHGRAEKGWVSCEKCRNEKTATKYRERMEAAELVEYDGPFFEGDTDNLYGIVSDYLDYCDDEGIEPDEFAFVPVFKPISLCYSDIVCNVEEDHAEGVEAIECPELEAAVNLFNELNKNNGTYWGDYKKKFRIQEAKAND